jgi:TRAP transporter TAXI family solute receptor
MEAGMQFRSARVWMSALILGAASIAGMVTPAHADFNDKKPIKYTVTGASVQGYFKVVVEAINGIVRDVYPDSAATFRPGSPAGGILEVATGKAEFTFTSGAPEIQYALDGKRPFKQSLKGKVFHVMMLHRHLIVHNLMTKEWSEQYGIKTFDDIASKKPPMRLAVNNLANLQSTLGMHIAIFKAHGFHEADIEKWGGSFVRGNSGIGLDALRDGKADVFINGRFLPDSTTADVARGRDLAWIAGDPAKMKKAADEWGYETIDIPKSTYHFLTQDVTTLKMWNTINTGPHVSEETVYKFVKAIYDNQDRVRSIHPSLAEFSGEEMIRNPMNLPFHPGAERFYREKGLLK